MWGAAFLLLGLYLVRVLVSFCLPDPRGGIPWRQAGRGFNYRFIGLSVSCSPAARVLR